jgi:peptide/nickel transport system substrate-binding protein
MNPIGWRRPALAVGIAACLAAAAGCGGGGSSAGGGTTTAATTGTTSTTADTGKQFAVFRATWAPPDYMDPGLSYTTSGWAALWNVYMGLLTYNHAAGPDGAKLIPGLASGMPKVSDGGKTYAFTLRPNLKYSNGTPVKASDFAYTIKRDFLIDSSGVGFFSGIVGANHFASTKKGNIPGIITDDSAGTITIKLTAPQGDFLNILATMFAAFVPTGTPNKDQSTTPIPALGPYMIQSYSPNRSFVAVRNPNWCKCIPGVPNGNPDKLQATIIEDDAQALNQVLLGNSDYDQHTIPVDQLASVQSKHADQLKFYTPANVFYFFMNQRLPPFDKQQVREAVNYGIDRAAIVKIFGGLGIETQNFLPPTYPQYKKINAYHYDMAKAKALIKASGDSGMAVTVWGNDSSLSSKTATYLQGQLNAMGLNAKVKIIARGVYWSTVGNQATKAQIGWADWYQDYPHPLDWFDVLLNGNRITQVHNNNYGNVDVKPLNAKIEQLKKEPFLTPAVNQQWAAIDKAYIVGNAAVAPFLNEEATDFFGSKVDTSCYVNHVLYAFDWSQICMK